jgi:DNA transposition AAA+ family ATPase
MTETRTLYNSVAPLANVARLTQLVERLTSRAYGLPGLGCYYGRAGSGKTTAGVYATNRFDAVHVEALPFGGVKQLLTMIVVELGQKVVRPTVPQLFEVAAEQLARTQRPLILDEADHLLTDKMIETVRRLHDVSGAPVILMGEELLPQKLQRWERVHGRILSWVGAEAATIEDVGHLAPIYCPGVAIAPDLRQAILAASRGSIRNVSTNLANVSEFAAVRGLQKLDLAAWGGAAFHTGEAPVPRIAPRQMAALKRRGAAA